MQEFRLAFRMVRLPGTLSMLSRPSTTGGLWDLTVATSNAWGCARAGEACVITVKSKQEAAGLRPAGPVGKLVRSLDRPPHICIGGLFCTEGGLSCIEGGLISGCDCSRSVFGGVFHMVEDDDLRRTLLRLQFDPELVLQPFQKGRPRGIRLRIRTRFEFPFEGEIEVAGEPRSIDHGALQLPHRRQRVRNKLH